MHTKLHPGQISPSLLHMDSNKQPLIRHPILMEHNIHGVCTESVSDSIRQGQRLNIESNRRSISSIQLEIPLSYKPGVIHGIKVPGTWAPPEETARPHVPDTFGGSFSSVPFLARPSVSLPLFLSSLLFSSLFPLFQILELLFWTYYFPGIPRKWFDLPISQHFSELFSPIANSTQHIPSFTCSLYRTQSTDAKSDSDISIHHVRSQATHLAGGLRAQQQEGSLPDHQRQGLRLHHIRQ